MSAPLRELGLFVLRVILLVVVFALLWPLVAPRYGRLVAGGSSRLLADDAVRVWVDEEGNLQADREWRNRRGRRVLQASPVGVRGSWEGLLLVAALMLATPRLGWKRRLLLLTAAVAALWVFHVLYVVAYFQRVFHPERMIYFWFPFSEVWVPLFLWATLSFPFWFPHLARLRRAPA